MLLSVRVGGTDCQICPFLGIQFRSLELALIQHFYIRVTDLFIHSHLTPKHSDCF